MNKILTFDSSTLAVTGNVTAIGNFVCNGSMTVGSYGVFGSLVANDLVLIIMEQLIDLVVDYHFQVLYT
ncbi:MAG: hypothetical protein CM15mV142_550 [Caudoviricetes sp.]|nr:MAG: hypothetical protein CM15mV142_550 [Caudoviricetes sp.]